MHQHCGATKADIEEKQCLNGYKPRRGDEDKTFLVWLREKRGSKA